MTEKVSKLWDSVCFQRTPTQIGELQLKEIRGCWSSWWRSWFSVFWLWSFFSPSSWGERTWLGREVSQPHFHFKLNTKQPQTQTDVSFSFSRGRTFMKQIPLLLWCPNKSVQWLWFHIWKESHKATRVSFFKCVTFETCFVVFKTSDSFCCYREWRVRSIRGEQ